MLKQYIVNGKQFQYEEGDQPECAIELKQAEPKENKTVTPKNKQRKVKTK